VLQQKYHGGCIKLSVNRTQQTDLANGVIQRFSLDEFCQFEDAMFGFDNLVKFRYEGVVECLCHLQLLPNNLHHVVLLYLSLVEQLSYQIFDLFVFFRFVAGHYDGTLKTFVNVVDKFDVVVVNLHGFNFHLF